MPSPVFPPTTKIDALNDGNSGSESTPEPNTGACDEFIVTAVRKESTYIMAAKDNERQRTYEMAQETVTPMWKAEFPLMGFRLDMLRPLLLKSEVADEIGI